MMFKRNVAAVTAALALLCLLCPASRAAEAGAAFQGSGTLVDPYLISSVADLRQLRDEVDFGRNFRGAYFAQTEDIAFPEEEIWNPIGDLRQNLNFQGVYDGRGHVIRNLHAVDEYAGLFAFLGGEVRNLGIESGLMEGVTVGSIASHGTVSAKIINCYNKAEVRGQNRAGGVTDNFAGLILFSWNLGPVVGTGENAVVAGITSYGSGRIQYSYCTGAEPVSAKTFSGELRESRQVSASDMAGILHNNQTLMGKNTPEPVNNNGIAAMEVSRGTLIFSSYTSVEARYLTVREQCYDFDGAGTERDPFLINSVKDLERLRDSVNFGVDYNGYYFAQTTDLSFPDNVNWRPIGEVKRWIPFRGVYDGRGHTLSNLRCVDEYAGFFGALDGEARNLGIESGHFEGVTVGSITSHGGDNAKLINCYNKAEVKGSARAGGLSDNFNHGRILYSWNFGDVTGAAEYAMTGGLVSYGWADIRYSYTATGEPTAEETFSGTLEESGTAAPEDIPELMENAYVAMAKEDRRLISKRNIVFLQWLDGTLSFSDSIPAAYASASIMRYIPVALLGVAAAALCAVVASTRARRNKKRKETAEEETADSGESDAESEPVSLKTRGKRLLSVLLTVAIFLVAFSCVFDVLSYKDVDAYRTGIWQMMDYRKKENSGTDVLCLGSSRIGLNLDYAELWRNYGIAGFWAGAAESTLSHSYYRMVEAVQYHVPQVVIVDVSPVITRNATLNEDCRRANYIGMPYSLNKLNYVNATIPAEERVYFFLDFPFFHQRYFDINAADFVNEKLAPHYNKSQGYLLLESLTSFTPQKNDSNEIIMAIAEESEYYLRKIMEFCNNNSIPLVLAITPDLQYQAYQPMYRCVEYLAREYGVNVLDMNVVNGEAQFEMSDFYSDSVHLVLKGTRKMAKILGDYLCQRFDFQDHRAEKGYETWDLFASDREDQYLRMLNDNSEYFAELARDERRLIVVPFTSGANVPGGLRTVMDSLEALSAERMTTVGKLSLGDSVIDIRRTERLCSVLLNGKSAVELSSSGMVLIVYDPVLNEIADIAAFSSENQYAVQHYQRG